MSTARPLSARVTLFSSRLMLNTDVLEMANLPRSSCPRTGTWRGPSTGSSYLISFTLDKSVDGKTAKSAVYRMSRERKRHKNNKTWQVMEVRYSKIKMDDTGQERRREQRNKNVEQWHLHHSLV